MTRMPVLYLSHGAPPLADDTLWTDQLARWSADLPKPEAILMVSAHWEEAPLSIGATRQLPLVYDFWGFPERYYKVRYDAPGAPELAADLRKIIPGVHQDEERGLDHGAYVPLVEMYPDADVPVLQMSMPTLEPERLFEVGRSLAPLRDQGVLIIGSGFTTHNLRELRPEPDAAPPAWSAEFDEWADLAVTGGDIDALLDFRDKAPAARIAHPRTEHFEPLFVALGADADQSSQDRRSVIDGYWLGLAKRSFQFN
ncbi:dioxygenase [Actinomadura sp. BRA 177]|uniref:dioxygenase family protein n=1 Tax=Actinomadura sp. BRA 177 TaxID=2745202 RepID=UPI001595EE54|nr:class III extradiol ring-cleavage dioxygenase [Actinomadura sp. BRA 177]NVI87718.1 dioxygenase [Actinomadura sp. BRA 177]